MSALLSTPATEYLPALDIRPLTPVIGAEIFGVDLRQPLAPETVAEIRTALNKWRVVFFRDQPISNEQLIAFGRSFGPLTPAHPRAIGLPDYPEIWERKAADYKTRRIDENTRPPSRKPPRDYKGWHIDITFVANPNKYSILYGADIPAYGGDTLFSNMALAYQELSAPIKALIDGLQAVHGTSSYDTAGERRPDRKPVGPLVSLHPLVRVHPETGEKTLFVSPGTSHIAGLRGPESDAILDLLVDELMRPEYQCRFRWQPHSLAMWDNQAVAHAGPIDYAHFDLPRVVRRITVAGDLPRGPDGFQSRPLEGELFEVIG